MMDTTHAEIVVPGCSCRGTATRDPHPDATRQLFVTSWLGPDDAGPVLDSVGVVCEDARQAAHAAVFARTQGKPVLRLHNATRVLSEGHEYAIDGVLGTISADRRNPISHGKTTDMAAIGAVNAFARHAMAHQLSVVDPGDVARINTRPATDVASIFLREEILWLLAGTSPAAALARLGEAGVETFLMDRLHPYAEKLAPGQTLNFRCLDARSDEYKAWSAPCRSPETNPALGYHGIRYLLGDGQWLLRCEIRAVHRLRAEEDHNVMLSLPFVTTADEVRQVRRTLRSVGVSDIPLGVFVETPACVYELPRILDQGVGAVLIGTKDLAQAILACDRNDPRLAHLYSLTHLAVLAAVRQILDVCAGHNTPVRLFAFLEQMPFLTDEFPGLPGLSMCAGDYLRIRAAAEQHPPFRVAG